MNVEKLPADSLELITLIAEKEHHRLPGLYGALHDATTAEQIRRQRRGRGVTCHRVSLDLSRITDSEAALVECLVACTTLAAMEMDEGAAFFHDLAALLHASLYAQKH